MKNTITVAIVTRNRATDLKECLSSLCKQTQKIDTVLIIDNNSVDQTRKVIDSFSKILPITYKIEKKIGYPVVYNRALKEAKTEWVSFIDDDCVAENRWYDWVNSSVKRYRTCAAITGASKNAYPENVYASSFQCLYEHWRMKSIRGNTIRDFRVLDSRNTTYNKNLLSANSIVFDTSFVKGAEDSDLGLQIQSKHLKAVFVKEMIVFHKEPKTFLCFIKKKKFQEVAFKILLKKWRYNQIHTRNTSGLTSFYSVYISSTRGLSFLNKIFSSAILLVDYVLTRCQMYNHVDLRFSTKTQS